MPFYAVARGHRPGVYTSWDETKKQVEGFSNARHKKFSTPDEAKAYIAQHDGTVDVSNQQHGGTIDVSNQDEYAGSDRAAGHGPIEQPASLPRALHHSKCYAVAKGRISGVYMTWKEAEEQVKGMYSAKWKGFSCVEDAQLYIDDYKRSRQPNSSDPDPRDSTTLVAFTDGSAVNNGMAHCKAGWACVFPHNPAWNQSGRVAGLKQTNNRAEYWGVIAAIRRANEEDPARVKPLYIYTDSNLLISSMTEWISGWIEQGWIKADGNPVLNIDLLKTMLNERGERRIIWVHVKAHTNRSDWKSKWNDVADQMAKEQTRNDFSLKRGRPSTQRDSERGGGYSSKRGRPHPRDFDYQYGRPVR